MKKPPYATNVGARFIVHSLHTLHVSAPIGGHHQVVCNTKNSEAVTVYVNGFVAVIEYRRDFDW
jgi:hypothetical protein